jgi:hypothetical protein
METTMKSRNRVPRRVTLLSAMLIAGVAASAAAQTAPAAQRWDAWMGCWRAEMPLSPGGAAASAPYVCVGPTDRVSAVEVVTLDGAKVLARDTIDASGERHTATVQGCQASKVGEWSKDGRRVLLHSEITCPDTKRTTTGMIAMSPTGEWLDIQSVSASGNTGIRVTRYRDARPLHADSLPASIQRQFERSAAIAQARTLAGGALDVASIAEATRMVDTSVVQAWIVERGARFKLDAPALEALATAGVPGSVTDVMVGVSYPEHFALQQPRMSGGGYAADMSSYDSARVASRYINDRCFDGIEPLFSSVYGPCGSRYGYGSLYGYGLYGYNTYGGGYYPGYYGGGYGFYGAPVVVVKGDGQQQQQTHGRLIKGEGYTPGASSGGSTRTGSTSSGSGSGASASSGASSGSSSGSSGATSGGGRTAVARPPR